MHCTALSSLRFRLLALVLLAVLPALALVLYTAAHDRGRDRRAAQQSALRVTRGVSADQSRFIEAARQLLASLLPPESIKDLNSSDCDARFAARRLEFPLYADFSAVYPNGDVFCSALPRSLAASFAGRTDFQRVLETRDLAVGSYDLNKDTGRATISLGYPILNGGQIEAVVFGSLDLMWVSHLVAESKLPIGSTFTLIDDNRTVIVHYPDAEARIGHTLDDEGPLLQAMRRQREGTVEAVGSDGVPRLYGFTPLGGMFSAETYVTVGIPKSVAFAEANRLIRNNLIALGFVAVLALGAAWFGGDAFLLGHVRALLRTTRKLTEGDLSARTGLSHGDGELSELARAVDDMAAALQQRQTDLVYQAFHDPLTGLANRARFMDRLALAHQRAEPDTTGIAVLFLDLDGFKLVNDTLGHGAGDALLDAVGRRLLACVRARAVVARFGGDEFTLLVEDMDHPSAGLQVGERILDTLRQPFILSGREVYVTASIGLAVSMGDLSPDELVRRADVALYRAKGAGKDCIAVFDVDDRASGTDRLHHDAGSRRAIERLAFRAGY